MTSKVIPVMGSAVYYFHMKENKDITVSKEPS